MGDELMKKLAVTVALGLTLAGCVSSQNAQNEEYARLKATNEQALAACGASAKAGKFSSMAAYARCLNDADAFVVSTWGQNADLAHLRMAQRAAIFEQVDRKQITPAQAAAQFAQADAAIRSEQQRRNNATLAVAAQVVAQQQAAIAASNVALAASRPVTCYRMSYLVTCN
jgi:hypothetical protein